MGLMVGGAIHSRVGQDKFNQCGRQVSLCFAPNGEGVSSSCYIACSLSCVIFYEDYSNG